MPRLHDLQAAIMAKTLDRLTALDPVASLCDNRPLPASDRLGIHRNNFLLGLTEPLAAAFPVVAALVGDAFFARLTRDFIRSFPPRRPDLLNYGQEFPGFIAEYPAAAAIPYLSDMARLELALRFADHARDQEPLAPSLLQEIAPERLEQLRLTPHPSLRFVLSDFPLLAIWQAHQESDIKPVDLAQGGDHLLVFRPGMHSLIRRTGAGGFAFAMALATGQTLAASYHAALERDADFSLIDDLTGLLTGGVFVGFQI